MTPIIVQFDPRDWPTKAAQLIQDRIDATIQERGKCNVMLTGGHSAERLYAAWSVLPSFRAVKNAQFYFGDERCVLPVDDESNYGMSIRTLFYGNDVRDHNPVHRMEADAENLDAAARRYAQILPTRVDVLLLGVGEDGHIASLFPKSDALQDMHRRVVPTMGPKPPHGRLTITPEVIRNACSIFVLASGKTKAALLKKAMMHKGSLRELPLKLALHGTWLLDMPL